MRLDHLLSKEPLGTLETGHPRRDPDDSRSVHWLLGRRARTTRAKYPPRGRTIERCEGAGRAHCSALGVRASEHLENSIASASIYSQVSKGLRWMPWRQEPMKDASGCEKLRGAAEKAEIRRCPNGETRPGSCPVTQV